ncbi:MAG: glycosyltransferase family 2 protein [Candidatus Aminicenantes bacterium]|nr:glycosyltransferase family 2 protein [Candidatus Aminicenantes bacterium]
MAYTETWSASPLHLSVVIPAYNEEAKIGRDLERLFTYLEGRPIAAEALVVDDGSRDRTAEVARGFAGPGRRVRVLSLIGNRGKGRAVRAGVLAARGHYILVADAGGCVPFANLERGLGLLEAGCYDAAFGSRAAAGAVIRLRQPLYRRVGRRIFRVILRLGMGVRGIADTQCGFKLFKRGAARAVFGRGRIEGFMFDVETVRNARTLGLRLAEFPVDWTNDPDSRFHLVRGSLRNLADLVRIRFEI